MTRLVSRRDFVRGSLAVAGSAVLPGWLPFNARRRHGRQDGDLTLWYGRPAVEWVEALPIGNGRLGAMVFGTIDRERLQLNEDTLWSGGPKDWNNPGALDALAEVRRLIADGRYVEADEAAKKMMGPYTWNEHVRPPWSSNYTININTEMN